MVKQQIDVMLAPKINHISSYRMTLCGRYKINVVVSDSTGGMEIILGDREVRTLIGKRARHLFLSSYICIKIC